MFCGGEDASVPSSSRSAPLVDVQAGRLYVATASSSTVHIWSCGPQCTLLTQREERERERLGENAQLAWHPRGETLAVLVRRRPSRSYPHS